MAAVAPTDQESHVDNRTDRETVLEFSPEAVLERRSNSRAGTAEYRVAYASGPEPLDA